MSEELPVPAPEAMVYEDAKVYLVYMDEVKHVHWHMIPRFDEAGFNVFLHNPKLISDFSLAVEVKKCFHLL